MTQFKNSRHYKLLHFLDWRWIVYQQLSGHHLFSLCKYIALLSISTIKTPTYYQDVYFNDSTEEDMDSKYVVYLICVNMLTYGLPMTGMINFLLFHGCECTRIFKYRFIDRHTKVLIYVHYMRESVRLIFDLWWSRFQPELNFYSQKDDYITWETSWRFNIR